MLEFPSPSFQLRNFFNYVETLSLVVVGLGLYFTKISLSINFISLIPSFYGDLDVHVFVEKPSRNISKGSLHGCV